MKSLGKCKIKTVNPRNGHMYNVKYVIVKDDSVLVPLISAKAAVKMGLITINYDQFQSVNVVNAELNFCDVFPEVFDGKTGSLPGGAVHMTLTGDAVPQVRPARRIPEALKESAKIALEKLENAGKLKKVDSPTDWVNQMSLTVKKSGELRVCIDPRALNEVLRREHYKLPVMEDVLPKLKGASLFSICDLESGYHHCELDKESSLLTTFATPFGRYRWLRLPFGLKVSSEIFQKRLHQVLEGLEGIQCIADDILVYGDEKTHDDRVRKLLERCQTLGIRLNKTKCQFCLPQFDFMGHIVSKDGLKVDPKKVEAVLEMSPPINREEVERFKGMVNYLSKFVPKLSDIMQPIVALTRKDVEWNWSQVQDKAFAEVKRLLTQTPVLVYFDPKKQLVIQSDASNGGLGAVLLQDGHPIGYTSRTLTDAEKRYAVIEKEMLSMVNALEKWHQFTYGRPVLVQTDHKPLESIVKKPLDKAPKHLQSVLIRALAYDITVEYKRGKLMYIADTLSRACLPHDKEDCCKEFESVNSIDFILITCNRFEEIKRETLQDSALQKVKDVKLRGWPNSKSELPPEVSPYFNFRDELTVSDELVLRGERVVIPKQLRPQIKRDIHIGHTGVEGCLRRARESVYWPSMNAELKEMVLSCETCRCCEVSHAKEPLMSHEIPQRQWQKIGTDLFSLNGRDYLITVCYFSNFWEIDRLHDTKSKTVISKLKVHCARYGIPEEIVSDNEPQFSSVDMAKFMEAWGIMHKTISPYNSKSNGKVESAVKTAKRMLKKTVKSGEDQ